MENIANFARTLQNLTENFQKFAASAPRWPESWIDTLHRNLLAGRVRLCPHVGPESPRMFAAMWTPYLVVCKVCVPNLDAECPSRPYCDRCDQTEANLHPGCALQGDLVVTYRLCRDCFPS